jgi:RsiW-degrading membrane proteinase PrsW (M82 family)
MTDFNPYTASSIDPRRNSSDVPSEFLSPQDAKKAENVIREANQFWLAILAAIFCNALGMLFIVPWYTARLIQWIRLAEKYPGLLVSNPPSYSLADRFQRSKWKLIVCIIAGVVLLLFFVSLIALFLMVG